MWLVEETEGKHGPNRPRLEVTAQRHAITWQEQGDLISRKAEQDARAYTFVDGREYPASYCALRALGLSHYEADMVPSLEERKCLRKLVDLRKARA
jgi:hypothetical protein